MPTTLDKRGGRVDFLGEPIIVLAISVLLAIYTLMPKVNKHEVIEHLENSLKMAGVILLVTGAGSALGAVLHESGTM
ncbi:gluconate permease [Xenorhabdus budapestensis]|uniref:Gluconate permease n=1 Tax=Xenorhabdus budapestensis TaxID=290110 RepID=A0A2D0J0X2_XENBU|nr:gluconate permease [Xenorhabdus budapestensis]